jgi:hypothetical protein
MPQDLMVGCDLGIQGRSIRITDADEYTRQFFVDLNMPQAEAQTIPGDALQQSLVKVARPPDNETKEYTEKTLGGGKVASQKYFLDNDCKVLRFFCESEGLPFVFQYYLADDTVEIRGVNHTNDDRDAFPKMSRRQKLPFRSDVNQPALSFIGENYLTCDEIRPGQPINAFGRLYTIVGVDAFTAQYFQEKFNRSFEIGSIKHNEAPQPVERQVNEEVAEESIQANQASYKGKGASVDLTMEVKEGSRSYSKQLHNLANNAVV